MSPVSLNTFSPQLYFKIANEYQKINDNKVRNQGEIKNFLMK